MHIIRSDRALLHHLRGIAYGLDPDLDRAFDWLLDRLEPGQEPADIPEGNVETPSDSLRTLVENMTHE